MKLLPLLGSDQDGEVASAARALTRALAADNLDLHDLARLVITGASGKEWLQDRGHPEPSHARRATSPDDQQEDRRSEVRSRRVLQAGKILLPNGGIIDCNLRNRSQHGALIQLASLIGIPDIFTLRVPSTNETFNVKTIWRGDREIGVRRL